MNLHLVWCYELFINSSWPWMQVWECGGFCGVRSGVFLSFLWPLFSSAWWRGEVTLICFWVRSSPRLRTQKWKTIPHTFNVIVFIVQNIWDIFLFKHRVTLTNTQSCSGSIFYEVHLHRTIFSAKLDWFCIKYKSSKQNWYSFKIFYYV